MNEIIACSWEEYVASDRVNHSRLKRLKDSPWHYQHPPRNKKPSPDLQFGTWFHALLMEPDLFEHRYAIAPDFNKNSNAYKDAVKGLEVMGKEPIDRQHWDCLHRMREAVLSDPYARPLFSAGKAEQTLFFTDEATQLECKAKLDWLPADYPNVLVDLKTTRSAHPDDVRKRCWEYGYHTQAAFYSLAWEVITGSPPDAFLLVFIEKPDSPEDQPLPPQLYELDASFLREGRRQVRAWLDALRHYLDHYGDDPWPHYTQGLTELSPPAWARIAWEKL